jgi:inosose dehydratase
VNGLLDGVAGAPITWGVCEAPGWGVQLAPDRVLGEMAAIGLTATELGPEGFLPAEPGHLRQLLDSYGLHLVGGFLPVVLHQEEGLGRRLEHAANYADLLAGAGAEVLVLAAAAAQEGYGDTTELDDEEWARLLVGLDRIGEIAGARGLTVALHPHYGTAIERPHHIDRVLEASTVALCLDSGHLMVGGADPVQVAEKAVGRVSHVHLKDVAGDWAERLRAGHIGYAEAVRSGMYRPLGAGDLDVAGFVQALQGRGYRGWYVLEQDTVLQSTPVEGAGPRADASASLEFLRGVAAEIEQGIPVAVAGRTRAARDATPLVGEEG